MSKINCPNDEHKWVYNTDLTIRLCEDCDKWESIDEHEGRLLALKAQKGKK